MKKEKPTVARFSALKSLRAKLTIFVSLIMLITFISLAFVTNSSLEKTMNEQIDKEVKLSTEALVHEMDKFLQSKLSIIETLAKAAEDVHGDRAKSLEFIQKAVARSPEFTAIIYLQDTSGTQAFSHDGQAYDMSDRSFTKDLAAGKSIISNPTLSRVDGTLSIIIGAPIMKNGQPVGALSAALPIQQLSDAISAVKFGETGYAFVFDADGVIVWHPREEFITNQHVTDFNIPELEQAYHQSLTGEQATFSYEYEGEEKYGAYMRNMSGWTAMLSAPEKELYEPATALNRKLLTNSILLVAVGLILTFLMSITISAPVRRLRDAIDVIASGNLTSTIEVKGADEVAQAGRSFNQMAQSLRGLIANVTETSEHLAASAEQLTASATQTSSASETIAKSVQEVASGAQQQAESVHNGFDGVKEISEFIERSAERVQSISDIAASASSQSTEGAKVIQGAVHQMESISSASEATARTVEELKLNSEAIHEMIQVIREIADQTNLLALNASIEAARAGEQGRGFSVVASEVRKLAEQSAQSAEEIEGRIQTIWDGINYTANSIQNTVEEVGVGTRAVHEAGTLFAGIEKDIVEVAGQLQELSRASAEITQHSDELVATMELISSTSDQTAAETQTVSAAVEEQLATMEDITSSAANLSDRAEQLQQAVEKFRV